MAAVEKLGTMRWLAPRRTAGLASCGSGIKLAPTWVALGPACAAFHVTYFTNTRWPGLQRAVRPLAHGMLGRSAPCYCMQLLSILRHSMDQPLPACLLQGCMQTRRIPLTATAPDALRRLEGGAPRWGAAADGNAALLMAQHAVEGAAAPREAATLGRKGRTDTVRTR